MYNDDRFGIRSPIEQSLRHERILAKLLECLDLVARTKWQPECHHIVMLQLLGDILCAGLSGGRLNHRCTYKRVGV